MQYTQAELKEILRLHALWLSDDPSGRRADLSFADLTRANLFGANLTDANLRLADLTNANLTRANLRLADLTNANLSKADLRCANLRYANLINANLSKANLRDANLRYAILTDANLSKADLSNAKVEGMKCNEQTVSFALVCPEVGSFVGFKKVDDKIVTLEVPATAKRSSATTRKCRAEFAKVLSVESIDGQEKFDSVENTNYNHSTMYKVGELVYPDSWDDNRWNECSHGIHFFMTRQEAVNY
jgi:uncharacterized protein YjbI with pentapeptide repeats